METCGWFSSVETSGKVIYYYIGLTRNEVSLFEENKMLGSYYS